MITKTFSYKKGQITDWAEEGAITFFIMENLSEDGPASDGHIIKSNFKVTVRIEEL